MLRIHFAQHWFKLSDFACEEARYDSTSLRGFAGIDLGRDHHGCSHWFTIALTPALRRRRLSRLACAPLSEILCRLPDHWLDFYLLRWSSLVRVRMVASICFPSMRLDRTVPCAALASWCAAYGALLAQRAIPAG